MAWPVTGCSPDKAPVFAPVTPESGEPVVAPEKPPVPVQPLYVSPLTGMPAAEKQEARPVMVVINNAPQARPQSGLSQADLLFEVLAEGEITRLIAFFQSKSSPDPVGPVRSIRPYFISLGKGYGAIQVHAGGSPDGYETIKKQSIENLDEITNAGPYFWREKTRKAPHNLYTSLEQVRQGAAQRRLGEKGPEAPVYTFAASKPGDPAKETVAPGSREALKLEVTFLLQSYRVAYAYDQTTGVYERSINGSPHIDLNNEEPLKAVNVVVMGAPHKVLDQEGRREVKLTGSGHALLFQQGAVRPVEWRREREESPIRWYEQGREVQLQPGQTHVMIVPDGPDFEEHVVY
ncbi:DUF3048 domain-containing protein [Paenibacillus filicis]|uniref:DUF3048 domain-containing protein n=1 Tax=Paenibacillus filicis TaxID=669464 RepID=A0ABU9DPZ3_9BACL